MQESNTFNLKAYSESQIKQSFALNMQVMGVCEANKTKFRIIANPCIARDIIPDEMWLLAPREEGHLAEIVTLDVRLLYFAGTCTRDFL